MKKRVEKKKVRKAVFFVALVLAIMSTVAMVFAIPTGPDGVDHNWNETKAALPGQMINLSGGRVGSYNITADVQNTKWKAFVGEVVGSFTLDDSGGNTIYDWTLSSLSGRVFTTRKTTTPTWASVSCAEISDLDAENIAMNHTGTGDNITATFQDGASGLHSAFFVAGTAIAPNSCPTLNTYHNGGQNQGAGADFEEMVLEDDTHLIYATIMEDDVVGFDTNTYDFQLIVPEIGLPGFSGSTAYYIYVELD